MSREANPDMGHPLLIEMGYRELLDMVTPEEVRMAQVLLSPFLKEYGPAGVEKVAVLSYLFGVKQGCHEMCGDNPRGSLISHLIDANYMGRVYGFLQASLLSGKLEISPGVLQRFEFHPPDERY